MADADSDKSEHKDRKMTFHPLQCQYEVDQPQDQTINSKGPCNDSADEYSSGSDRSVEADSGDQNNLIASEFVPAKKKRRHGSHGSRRQKGGSRHKHRPGPYPETNDFETSLKRKSLELQEKENATSLLRQEGGEDQFVTFPVAPFNSTQFLIEEHMNSPRIVQKPEIVCDEPVVSTQDVALSPLRPPQNETESVKMTIKCKDKEFSDFYSSVHAENLENMSKQELVKHYMSLEEQVASLQKKVAEAEQRSDSFDRNEDCSKTDNSHCHSHSNSDTSSFSCGNKESDNTVSINNSPSPEFSGRIKDVK